MNAQPMVGNLAWAPLPAFGERHLEDAEPSELLHGLVFESAQWRHVTVGMAKDYRLFVEFDWNLPVPVPSKDLVCEMLDFLASSLKGLADEESVTPARRRAARKASRAVRELAVC